MREDAADLLARFPGPVVLYPSRSTYVVLMAVSVLFVGLGSGDIALGHAVIGWFLVMPFGLAVVLIAAFILPGANSLKLDREGFELTVWFRSGNVRWQDASGFTTVPVTATLTIVVFNLARGKSALTGAFLNRAFAQGRNASLPDNYGLRAADLVYLLMEWRERAIHAG